MKYFIVVFLFLYGCYDFGCGESGRKIIEYNENHVKGLKQFTIVNHTNKTYINNALYRSFGEKIKGIWKSYSFSSLKINRIEAQKTMNKDEEGKALQLTLSTPACSQQEYEDSSESDVTKGGYYLLSLGGGERKIFFGAYDYQEKTVYIRRDKENCISYYRLDIHPALQETELTIEIYEDKIKEAQKKSVQNSKEVVDLHTLEIVPCDEE